MVEGAIGIAIILLDTQGNVTGWNVGAERIFGYTGTEIIGHHFSRLYTAEEIARGDQSMN